jgi:hypothetical protein
MKSRLDPQALSPVLLVQGVLLAGTMILRGITTAEHRTQPTNIIGERFQIYPPLKKAWSFRDAQDQKIWSRDLAMPNGALTE